MKNITYYIKFIAILIGFYFSVTSCEDMMGDFLEKPPGVDVTEDTIFSSKQYAEEFLVGLYRDGVHTALPEWNDRNGRRDAPWSCYSDEGENVAGWYSSHIYNTAGITPYSNGDGRNINPWFYRWRAIRSANIYLERIQEVPDAEPGWIEQAAGQAYFIIGLNYFEMFKRYGGVPLVKGRFNPGDDIEDMKIPRATVEETINYIVEMADEAASRLPDSWPPEFTGKATKGAALMLKSRALLYAASPLSNTGNPPLSLPGDANKLICYGDYSAERWKAAADAAKAVIDWAPAGGRRILNDGNPDEDYMRTWNEYHNDEVIMSVTHYGRMGRWFTMVAGLTNFYRTQSGTMISQNFVEKYESKTTGEPMNWTPTGNNLNAMYQDADPRLNQSVLINGAYHNPDYPVMTFWEVAGRTFENMNKPRLACKTRYWLRKYVPPAHTNSNAWAYVIWNLYRLSEAYLNYAEALNEYASSPPQEAYNAVNVVRARAGMPDFPQGLTKEEFRAKIRNERSVELAFEGQRLFDIMRWRIAEQDGVMQGAFRGIKITQNPGFEGDEYYDDPNAYSWETFTVEQRTWKTEMYHVPIWQQEIDKQYMIQNPGW